MVRRNLFLTTSLMELNRIMRDNARGKELVRPFWQDLILDAGGPLITVVVGSLLIGLIVARVTQNAQERRADMSLRHGLVKELTSATTNLYLETQHYERLFERWTGKGQEIQARLSLSGSANPDRCS